MLATRFPSNAHAVASKLCSYNSRNRFEGGYLQAASDQRLDVQQLDAELEHGSGHSAHGDMAASAAADFSSPPRMVLATWSENPAGISAATRAITAGVLPRISLINGSASGP